MFDELYLLIGQPLENREVLCSRADFAIPGPIRQAI